MGEESRSRTARAHQGALAFPPADMRSFADDLLPSRQGRCSPVSVSPELFSLRPGIRTAPRGKANAVYPGDSFAFRFQ
ncbi:hypothetical protein STEG23_021531 [Scotinomys teguina]